MSSFAIYNAITRKEFLIIDRLSPIRDLKAIKSRTELERTRKCQVRDSTARIRHMYQLENEISKGNKITERSAAKMLEDIQSEDDLFKSASFESISAVGKNAALVHYATSESDDSALTRNEVYLLDAGAHYLDCTTDITRTHHFGTPTKEEVCCVTDWLIANQR
jgi:Xaa-Pro aminopeptidase